MNDGENRVVSATFDAADDLLWQAASGRLPLLPPLTLVRSGFVGPLVELAIGRMAKPKEYCGIVIEPPIFRQIERALEDGTISGAAARDRAGVFPLRRFGTSKGNDENSVWDQWASHTENAARAAGLPKGLAAGLMGALGELQDNVLEHSGRPDSGLVAYGASTDAFEFVVADAGRGVLASLRDNPEFTHLVDCGTALRVAASDGASRTPPTPDAGTALASCFAHSLMTPASYDFAVATTPCGSGATPQASPAKLNSFRRRGWTVSLSRCAARRGRRGDGREGIAAWRSVSYDFRTSITLCARRSSIGAPTGVGEFQPPQAARFGKVRSAASDGACERLGFDQCHLREVLPQLFELSPAAANNDRKRTSDTGGESAKLVDMPVDALGPTTAGGEFERQDLDLRSFGDEIAPSEIVMFRSSVDMQCRRYTRRRHLRPGQQNPLHCVEIVGARHVGQHAVVRRCCEGDTKLIQR